MARELDAAQADLAGRSHIAPVGLVKLTCYSDRMADTVAKVFYLSTLPCDYDYGNAGTNRNFTDAVVGGSEFFSGFRHIPDPDDLTSFRQAFSLHLSNDVFAGERMIQTLQAYNLEGASVEIGQILVNSIDSLPLDLTDYDGDEHTVLFRGRVNRVSPITESIITLQIATELPSMADSWAFASDDTKVDPIDLGKRLPRVYGKAKRVPLVSYDVGWLTTLSEPLTSSTTGSVEIADGSGLPAIAFNIRIDGEELTCTTSTDTTITISVRGVGATDPASHDAGALVGELVTTATYIVSDRESDALNELYVINPFNGMLLRLDTPGSAATPHTVTLADTTTISGKTITSVKFTAAQLTLLLDHFKAQAVAAGGITQQPAFSISGGGGESSNLLLDMTVQTASTAASLGDPLKTPTGLYGTRHMDGNGTGADNYVYGHIGTGDILSSDREIIRWRLRMVGGHKNTHTGSYTTFVKMRNLGMGAAVSDLNGSGVEELSLTLPVNSQSSGQITVGSWHTPVAGTTLAALEGNGSVRYIILYGLIYSTEDFNTDEWCEWSFAGYEVECEGVAAPTLSQTADAIAAAGTSVGFGLRFFADVDGVPAPDGTYEATSGVVMSHPADILKHWVEVVGGETLDTTALAAFVTSLGASAEWGFDARSLGFAWEEVLQRMAFESRCNIVSTEKSTGREWRLLAADNSYAFDAASATISQTHDMADAGRGIEDLESYFTFRYAFDASLPGNGNEEGFRLALVANPDVSDVPITTTIIGNAAARFGALDLGPIAFRCIQDKATAQDVAGYIVQERIANARRVFDLREVAWFDALPRDIGDIVSITAPWASSATTLRITSMSKAFKSNVWTITAVEVDTTGQRTP